MNAPLLLAAPGIIDKKVKAVIVYDDLKLAAQANVMLERAAKTIGEDVDQEDWEIQLWRASLLEIADIGTTALHDATDADLIVLALQAIDQVPSVVSDWLTNWALHREHQEALLAMWSGSATGRSGAEIELKNLAELHGLGFLIGGTYKNGSSLDEQDKRAEVLTPTLLSIRGHRFHENYQHWGINE